MDPADVAEVWAAMHKTPEEALEISKTASRETWAGRVHGEAVCVFGISQRMILDYAGTPWLLGTPEIQDHPRAFLSASRRWVQLKMRDFTILENFVDVRHTRAVRWLGWLGFTLEDPKPYGLDNLPFHHFYMKA